MNPPPWLENIRLEQKSLFVTDTQALGNGGIRFDLNYSVINERNEMKQIVGWSKS